MTTLITMATVFLSLAHYIQDLHIIRGLKEGVWLHLHTQAKTEELL
jgi:hypothetical protein